MKRAPRAWPAPLAAIALAVLLVLAAPACALSLLSHRGRWITDAQGRVVILHGMQIDRFEPQAPVNYLDISRANVRFLGQEGFNLARVSMSFEGVEPKPGYFDQSYVRQYLRLDHWLGAAGVYDLLDLQQGQYSPEFDGNGFPDWMAITGGSPNAARPFPQGYFTDPAENAAWDSFWANARSAGGTGLQALYGAGLARLASEYASSGALLGIDLLNEPWPGSRWESCASPQGCPAGGFDQSALTGFYRRVIPTVRGADPRHLVVYEPNLLFNSGASTQIGRLPDADALFAFHNYCLGAEPGLPQGDPFGNCSTEEQVVLQNADAQAARSGDALLEDEWGATSNIALLERMTAEADAHMVGWSYWSLEDCCQNPGAVLAYGSRPVSSAGNLRKAVLEALVRPYPQAIAGTPTSWSYDSASHTFHLSYSTVRAGGGRFRTGTATVVELPALDYPTGYQVTAHGARVISAPDADPLLLATRGRGNVSIAVAPAMHHPAPAARPVPTDCSRARAQIVVLPLGARHALVFLDGRRAYGAALHLRRKAHPKGIRERLPTGLADGSLVVVRYRTASGRRRQLSRRISGCRPIGL